MLSATLQRGNADVSTQGAADLLMHSYRTGISAAMNNRGPGRNRQKRTLSPSAVDSKVG